MNGSLGPKPQVNAKRKVNGVIFSDLGRASSFMELEWVQQALRKSLGFLPYPATLNLRPRAEEDSSAWAMIQKELKGVELPPAGSGFCSAQLFWVEISRPVTTGNRTVKGAVLLPEVPGYPKDKIEVVAPVRLKDEFGVRDGDQLTLEFVN